MSNDLQVIWCKINELQIEVRVKGNKFFFFFSLSFRFAWVHKLASSGLALTNVFVQYGTDIYIALFVVVEQSLHIQSRRSDRYCRSDCSSTKTE